MSTMCDCTKSELWTIDSTPKERYGKAKKVQLAETNIAPGLHSSVLPPCPTAYWQDEGCNLLSAKPAMRGITASSFIVFTQMYGTGIEHYDNLPECVTLLQVQADYAAKQGHA